MHWVSPAGDWTHLLMLTHVLQVCTGYPQQVIVPKAVDDETIVRAATFRQGARFPGTQLLPQGQPSINN